MSIEKNNKHNKKISIILDNYNYNQFLSEAIESVLNQTYTNYELIIVDDGSTDNSQEIINCYMNQYSNVKAVFKENGGQTSAFNEAFTHCSGEIVAFLDSDDYWYPDKLFQIAEKHNVNSIVQHYLSYNGDGIYRRVNTDINWHDVLMEHGYLYNHSVCSSLSFSYELLNKIFPLINPEEMRFCTDGIVLMMALSMEPVGFIENVLGYYRVHGQNLFVGSNDFGQKARALSKEQQLYVNKQLVHKGHKLIPFDNHKYFIHLIKELLEYKKIETGYKILIYGTEASGLYMTQVLEDLGFEIWGYCDTNSIKHGHIYNNKLIYSPIEITEHKHDYDKIMIASSAGYEISETLNKMGFVQDMDYIVLPI